MRAWAHLLSFILFYLSISIFQLFYFYDILDENIVRFIYLKNSSYQLLCISKSRYYKTYINNFSPVLYRGDFQTFCTSTLGILKYILNTFMLSLKCILNSRLLPVRLQPHQNPLAAEILLIPIQMDWRNPQIRSGVYLQSIQSIFLLQH